LGKNKKFVREKNLIRKVFKEELDKLKIYGGIGSRSYKDGIWSCSWGVSINIPEAFNAMIRNNAEVEIKPYMEKQYTTITDIVNKCFGNKVTHTRYKEPNRLWYNFTYHFPIMNMAMPERWEHVNGVFQKVEDARLLTEDEIDERIQFWINRDPYYKNKYIQSEINTIKWERDNWRNHFEFIGGSPFTDECFRQFRYAGINMYGNFTFEAFGNYLPGE
jgi:hypothetical protein